MPDFCISNSLHEIDRGQWKQCFTDEVEDYDYLLAVEKSGIAGFTWRYLTVYDNGKIVAAAPLFLTNYKLDTTLQGAGKKITIGLSKAFPKLLNIKLASIGSPCTENAMIGFAPNIGNRMILLKQILNYFEEYAASENCKLIGIKDMPEKSIAEFANVFKEKKYSALPGMPSAWLEVNFKNIDEYISHLSPKMRQDLRRKMRGFTNFKVEYRKNIDDILSKVFELYQATRSRSDWQFEELTENFFKNVLSQMPNCALCVLYYSGDELLAADLLIHNQHTLLNKFFCMADNGRQHNLYFLSWISNLRICLERGYTRYESGQAYNSLKPRLGSRLSPNMMYFKHRNFFLQHLLKLISPLFSSDVIEAPKNAT